MPVADRKIGSSALSALAATTNDDAPGVAWSNEANAIVDDANYATASLNASSSFTRALEITNLTLSPGVPASVRLTKISFTVTLKTTNGAKDKSVLLWDGSATLGTDQAKAANYSTSDEAREYTFDVTGLGLSASDVLATGFGIAFQSEHVSGLSAIVSLKLFENFTAEWTMRKNRSSGF